MPLPQVYTTCPRIRPPTRILPNLSLTPSSFPTFSARANNYRGQSHRTSFLPLAAAAAAAAAGIASTQEEDPFVVEAECCGIVGALGLDNETWKVLADGITILQNRGYDSAGIATVDKNNQLTVSKIASVDGENGQVDKKYVDAIEAVKLNQEKHAEGIAGIAHTRWATHGGKTDANAHPHTSICGDIVLVHNGTISNYRHLKSSLEAQGIYSRSETDTEVIVNLLAHLCRDDPKNFETAFNITVERLRGTWGLVVLHRQRPDIMLVSRHGSPLLIGHAKQGNGLIVASEQSAFNGLVDQYVEMDENETIVLQRNGVKKLMSTKMIHQISCDSIFLSPDPYQYWTEKEIQEQPKSILAALGNMSRIRKTPNGPAVVLGGLDKAVESLDQVTDLIYLGCGTSYHAAEFSATLHRKLKLFRTCRAEDASEFVSSEQIQQHTADDASTAACIYSQSGETLDCMLVVDDLKKMGVTLFSIINVVGSALARKTGLGVYINAGREVAVASTKAFMCQSVISCLVACWFHQRRYPNDVVIRNDIIDSLCGLDQSVDTVLKSLDRKVEQFADKIVTNRSMFILGKGLGYPVALEGALKIKEISYLHAEAFGGGSLKHGPFALLSPEERTPVILLIFRDENTIFMMNAAEQVKARGSRLVIITDLDEAELSHLTDDIWSVPSAGLITPLLAVIPMQLLAFYLSKTRGYNPDKPRGLAKTVTVW